MAELKTKIILRNDSSDKWESVKDTAVLLKGEMGIEFLADGKTKTKIGDGVKTWAELPYFGGEESKVFQVGSLDEITETELAVGDVAIVKEEFSGKTSYTSYVYSKVDGEEGGYAWAAMDGNYNAENVYFDEDLITSYAMGQIKLTNGAATIPAAGKNLKQVWDAIYLTETKTNLQGTKPSCTISANDTVYLEVGKATTAQTVTLGLNKGKYDYGYGYVVSKDEEAPAAGTAAATVVTNDGTGVVAVATAPYALTYDGASINPVATNGNTFSIPSTTKTTAPSSAGISCTVKYENAGNPVSNLGNIYAAQAYADGTSAAATKTLACWYYPIYSGFTYTDGAADSATEVVSDHANITAARVQKFDATTGKTAYDKTKVTSATAAKAWRQYFYAFPADYSWVMKDAKDGNGIDCTVKQAANVTLNFSGTDVVYNVYYIHNAADYGTLGITWSI